MIRVRYAPEATSHLASNKPWWNRQRSGKRGFLLFEDLVLDGNERPLYWLYITPRDAGGVALTILWPARQGGEGTPGDCSNQSREDLHLTHHCPSENAAYAVANAFAHKERARLVALAIQQFDEQRTLLQGTLP